MKKWQSLILMGVVGAALAAGAARADTIVWIDPVDGFSISYPDSWTVQTDDRPTTRLRVAGPYGEDLAACRMQVQDDGRVKIYPKERVDEAVMQKLDQDAWQAKLGEFDQAQMMDYYAPAGLGDRGDATAVKVSFMQHDGEKKVPMYGVMIASIHGGKQYVASCFSRAEAYGKWSLVFMSILDSVSLDSRYHPFAIGFYRDFLSDPVLMLPRIKPGTTVNADKGIWERLTVDKYHKKQ